LNVDQRGVLRIVPNDGRNSDLKGDAKTLDLNKNERVGPVKCFVAFLHAVKPTGLTGDAGGNPRHTPAQRHENADSGSEQASQFAHSESLLLRLRGTVAIGRLLRTVGVRAGDLLPQTSARQLGGSTFHLP